MIKLIKNNDLTYEEEQAKLESILDKLGITIAIFVGLMLDCLVLWFVFLLCDMVTAYTITLALNIVFILITTFLVIFDDKLQNEKRLRKIEHQIEELKSKNEKDKEWIEDKLHELDIRLEDLGGWYV